MKELVYKDRRSVWNWCRKMGVRIFCDIGSNRKYLNREEFEFAKCREIFKYINRKNKPEYIQSNIKFFSEYLEAKENKEKKQINYHKYVPSSEIEASYLSRLLS